MPTAQDPPSLQGSSSTLASLHSPEGLVVKSQNFPEVPEQLQAASLAVCSVTESTIPFPFKSTAQPVQKP
jgi:hypothetical protein